jgi:hypothetical protein
MPLDYCCGPGSYTRISGDLVRLDEGHRKSVVLIGTAPVDSRDLIEPWGTAFIVGVGLKEAITFYLVTAWHVVANHADAPFHVRFNRRDGGAENYLLENPEWFFHPTDSTVDVAVHEIDVPKWAECAFVPSVPTILLEDRIGSKNIGAGNRTYTVGLWRFLHGTRRNQPYVYTGHIGLMPEDDERIPVNPWLPAHGKERVCVEAYLVEGEPLNGASGSPVFVRRTLNYPISKGPGKTPLEAHLEGSVWLLGLLSDAFTAKAGEDYEVLSGAMVPRGVNVVVPSMRIMDVLNHPTLKARREAKQRA